MRLYTVYYISVNCCTCFGWLLHPSSGAHIYVITASGTGQTVSAIFRYRGTVKTDVPDAVITVICAPDDGWGCHPKHVEQFTVIQGVPLATKLGISLIILTPMKILQRNLNWSTFVV